METDIATWRARIGLFNSTHKGMKSQRKSSHPQLYSNNTKQFPSSFILLLTALFVLTFSFVSVASLFPLENKQVSQCLHHASTGSPYVELAASYFLQPETSIIPLCMDIHPNPGPTQNFYELPAVVKNAFNQLKRIQQKLARYRHHLKNYSFFIRKKIVPLGLLPKTGPAFDSRNPQFLNLWRHNQHRFAMQQLKLLIKECKIKIKDLQNDELNLQNELRSLCDGTTFVMLTEKLSSYPHAY